MGKDKAASRLGAGITSPQPGEDPTPDLEVEVEISPPQTAEDFVLFALERATLEEIVKILRDLYGRKEVKAALNRLHHRDPVSDVIHTRRHAVEIYAKEHGMTPANLMVKLRGTGDGADPAGSERYKLREARKYLEQDTNSRVGAAALARHWEETRPEGRDPVRHIKGISPEI